MPRMQSRRKNKSAKVFVDSGGFLRFFASGKNDDLTKTISYSDVKKTLKSFCENNCFNLIETLATRAAEVLLKNTPQKSRCASEKAGCSHERCF